MTSPGFAKLESCLTRVYWPGESVTRHPSMREEPRGQVLGLTHDVLCFLQMFPQACTSRACWSLSGKTSLLTRSNLPKSFHLSTEHPCHAVCQIQFVKTGISWSTPSLQQPVSFRELRSLLESLLLYFITFIFSSYWSAMPIFWDWKKLLVT